MWPNTVIMESPEPGIKLGKWVFGCAMLVLPPLRPCVPSCVIWVLKALR